MKNKIKTESSDIETSRKYIVKFCEKWKDIFKPWLVRAEENREKPFCRACQQILDSNRFRIQRHAKTTKHLRNLEILLHEGEDAARENYKLRKQRSRPRFNLKIEKPVMKREASINLVEEVLDEDIDDMVAESIVYEESSGTEQFLDESDPIQHTDMDNKSSLNVHSLSQQHAKCSTEEKLMQLQKEMQNLSKSVKDIAERNSQPNVGHERSHVDLFFESVTSSIKSLSPKLIAEAKMRVSNLVCELELRSLTE